MRALTFPIHQVLWKPLAGILLVCFGACSLPEGNILDLDESRQPRGPALVTLYRELSPLREAFNHHRDQERLMLLISPSCGTCAKLLGAVKESWLADNPDRALILVFQRVYPQDGLDLVRHHLRDLPTDRVHALMDEQRLAASWMTRSCLPLGIGRHLVMVFPPGMEWTQSDPVPIAWCHAMGGLRDRHQVESDEFASWLQALGNDVAQGRR